jgi:hypothetical protein
MYVYICSSEVLNALGNAKRLQWKRENMIFSPTTKEKTSTTFTQDWSRVNNPGAASIVEQSVSNFADIVAPLRRSGHSTLLIRARVLPTTQWTYSLQLRRFTEYLSDVRRVTRVNPIQSINDLDAYLVDFAEAPLIPTVRVDCVELKHAMRVEGTVHIFIFE